MGPGVKKSGPQAVPSSTWTSRVALTSLRGQEVRGQRAKGGWQRPGHGRGRVPGMGWDRNANQSSSWSGPGAEAQALESGVGRRGFPL